MEHILHNSHDIFINETTRIKVTKNTEIIFETVVPLPNFSGESLEQTQVQHTFTFSDSELLNYELQIISEFGNISYDLYCEEYIEDCEVIIQTNTEESNLPIKSYINTYVPLIKYTTKSKELVSKTIANAENKDVIPLIDIRKEKNIDKYLNDNFNIPHFLDLCDMNIVTNTEEREKIKEYRKIHKGESNLPDIPSEEEVPLTKDKIVEQYITLARFSNFIPVCRIDTTHSADLNFGTYASNFLTKFDTIVLRIVKTKNFKSNIQSYLIPFISILRNSYLLIEFDGIDDKYEQDIVQFILSLHLDIQIIYAKETTNYSKHTIHLNYFNIFPNTSLSSYIDRLSDCSNELWYSDYCGYDRDTATEYIIGMKPNVSLYLLDNTDGLKILILKIKESSERGTAAWSKSAELLVNMIQSGKIPPDFLNELHCDACKEIANTKKITLASAKFLSMLHNCITIAKI